MYESDKKNMGYSYFTSNFREALMYGLSTSLLDMYAGQWPEEVTRTMIKYRDPVGVIVKTSNLKHMIERDPEAAFYDKHDDIFRDIETFGKRDWYRIKGDIPLKYLLCKEFWIYETIPQNTIDTMIKLNKNMKLLDKFKMTHVVHEIDGILDRDPQQLETLFNQMSALVKQIINK